MVVPLNKIEQDERVTVVWIASQPAVAGHLGRLGFVPQAEIVCILKGRQKDMMAFLVGRRLIALRSDTAGEIFVKKIRV